MRQKHRIESIHLKEIGVFDDLEINNPAASSGVLYAAMRHLALPEKTLSYHAPRGGELDP